MPDHMHDQTDDHHRPATQAALPAATPRLHPVLGLQQRIGNRAVQRFLKRPPALQRDVPVYKFSEDEHAGPVQAFVKDFNDAVQKAYTIVLHKPLLEDFGEVDGHIEHWRETWRAYLAREDPPLTAAAFGYAVESMTGLLLPTPPEGYVVHPQQTRGGTRPDFVLGQKGGGDIAWIDITASDSENHIYNKEDWNRAPHFAEVTYPSTNMETIRLVASSPAASTFDYKGIDPEAVKKQIAEAKDIHRNRQAFWQIKGDELFSGPLPRADPLLRDQIRMRHAIGILNKYFGEQQLDSKDENHRRIAASILVAMNVNPNTYGFVLYSTSRSRGEAYLQENDPNIPEVDKKLREAREIAKSIGSTEVDMEDEFFTQKN